MSAPLVVLTASAVGAAHVRHGRPADDAVGGTAEGDAAVVVVADGHSDPRCVRARRGAELAVAAVLAQWQGPSDPMTLGAAVVADWQARVRADLTADPQEGLTPLAYGTTLIAARVRPGRVEVLQIGDGDAVVVVDDGTASRPLPPSCPSTDGATDSLSDGRAIDLLRAATVATGTGAALVALTTDGIDNAYADDMALLDAVRDIQQLHPHRHERRTRAELQRWAERAAATSGDDASVAVIAVAPQHAPLLAGGGR